MQKICLSYLILAPCMALLLCSCDPDPAPLLPPPWDHEGTQVDEELQNFTVVDTSGNAVSPEKFRGKVLLLMFLAPWSDECRSVGQWIGCNSSGPGFDCYLDRFKAEGLETMIILIDDENGNIPDVSYARQWRSEFGISDPVYIDNEERDIFNTYSDNIPADRMRDSDSYFVPLILVVDRNFIVFSRDSEFSKEDLESDLSRLY